MQLFQLISTFVDHLSHYFRPGSHFIKVLRNNCILVILQQETIIVGPSFALGLNQLETVKMFFLIWHVLLK